MHMYFLVLAPLSSIRSVVNTLPSISSMTGFIHLITQSELFTFWVYLHVSTLHCLVHGAERLPRKRVTTAGQTHYRWTRGLAADFTGVKRELIMLNSSFCIFQLSSFLGNDWLCASVACRVARLRISTADGSFYSNIATYFHATQASYDINTVIFVQR